MSSLLTAQRSLSSLTRAPQGRRVIARISAAESYSGSGGSSFAVRSFSTPPPSPPGGSPPPPPPPPGGDKPFRLRRPSRLPQQGQQQQSGQQPQFQQQRPGQRGGQRQGGGQQQQQQGTNRKTNPGAPLYTPAYPGTRPNALALFPGDYGDNEFDMDDDDDDDDDYDNVPQDPEEIAYRERVRAQHEKEQAQKQKWLENAQPVDWPVVIDDERGRSYGRGGRKRAQARVWIQPGYGEIVVNNRPFIEYFDRLSDRDHILEPFVATETCGKFDAAVHVRGGGLTGQAGAIRLGVARALNAYNPDLYRPPLKFLNHLTRDARKVERKKVGHVKARKSPQWVRR